MYTRVRDVIRKTVLILFITVQKVFPVKVTAVKYIVIN